MINNSINTVLFLILTFYLNITLQAQITRGAGEGELYISTGWYMDNNGQVHYAIFHTTDNGEHITLKYENIETPPPDEMKVGKVLGDATPGTLYNYGNNELWVSFDYGGDWGYKETYGSSGRFASGCVNGEIYKCCVNVQGTIWRSTDYGDGFFETTEDAKYVLEVGVLEGDVYGRDGNAGIGYNLYFSNDFTVTFDTIPIDSTVAFWSIGGYQPRISRGTESGEIYLVSWWLDSNYKIFHSSDTGYTWTEKFESETIDIYYWRVAYTAGREPGSFYVLRSRINPAGDHAWMYIDYSNDYGETFTTYFHDLDSTITSVKTKIHTKHNLSSYPNPFKSSTQIWYKLENESDVKINIYNSSGQLIKSFNERKKTKGAHHITFDANGLKNGIYFYSININGKISDSKKMTIIK